MYQLHPDAKRRHVLRLCDRVSILPIVYACMNIHELGLSPSSAAESEIAQSKGRLYEPLWLRRSVDFKSSRGAASINPLRPVVALATAAEIAPCAISDTAVLEIAQIHECSYMLRQ